MEERYDKQNQTLLLTDKVTVGDYQKVYSNTTRKYLKKFVEKYTPYNYNEVRKVIDDE